MADGICDGVFGICSKQTLGKWASREATVDEVARLQRVDARQRSHDSEREISAQVTAAVASRKSDDPFAEHFPDGFALRDEANALVAWAFRNGPLEDLHAGRHSELLEDPSLSRITDEEMKILMVSACRQLTKLLELKATNPTDYEHQIKSYNWRYCRNWER